MRKPPCEPGGNTGKDIPRDDKIPPECDELPDWNRNDCVRNGERHVADPILSLRGLGKEICGRTKMRMHTSTGSARDGVGNEENLWR